MNKDVNDRTTDAYLIKVKKELRQALLKGRYYTRVVKVAESGMSRKIEIGYIKNNVLYKMYRPEILEMAGISKTGRIDECGMDMLFEAQYNLFLSLFGKKKRYQTDMKRYNEM